MPDEDPLTAVPDVRDEQLKAQIEAIKEWFFENFEDPAEITPYESAEGGYIFIWGGLYDARDQIENKFYDNASEEAIEEAIQEIQVLGWEWAPNRNRRRAPAWNDDDFDCHWN